MPIQPHRESWRRAALAALGLALAFLGAAGGCGPADGTERAGAAATPARLEVRQPRALLTPGMGAVYFSVFNPGPQSDRLLRVETPVARAAETHESVYQKGGVVRMEPRPGGFEVPAGGTLELEPGGKHVMLIEIRLAAGAGGPIPLTLHFARAGAVQVQAVLLEGGGHR